MTSGGSDHPFSADRIYDADATLPDVHFGMDASAEIGDSLTEEAMGAVIQDLETPYRPNTSSYDSTEGTSIYEQDDAQVEHVRAVLKAAREEREKQRADPHPSASTPSFQSLAIFTGESLAFPRPEASRPRPRRPRLSADPPQRKQARKNVSPSSVQSLESTR